MNSFRLRISATALALLAGAAFLGAQSPNCAVLQGNTLTQLPTLTNTLPGSADMTTAGGSNYLYVLTQWGVTRAALTNPANPGPYSSVLNIGAYAGAPGIIPIRCDCFSGASTMDVAEQSDGTARMITDWPPYSQGGPPGGDRFSGLPGMVVKTSASGSPGFGQQIELSNSVPIGGRIAAIFIPPNKYFAYFPVLTDDVYLADISNPTGATGAADAINPTPAIGWHTGSAGSSPVRMTAAHIQTTTYDKYVLVGATDADNTLHVAEINTGNGHPTEVASGSLVGYPNQLQITVVDNRIFIFSAEGGSGTQVYEFLPSSGAVLPAGSIPGTSKRVAVRGPQPFPALFIHRSVSGSESWIDIYDTKWLTQGGAPLLAKSLRHVGATDAAYRGQGFEALVVQNGGSLTAYLYREVTTAPQMSVHTDTIDISCIAADPTAPPVPYASMTNLSAAGRPAPENTKNYFGDKWQIKDASVSYMPITELDWDFHYTGTFAPEVIANPPGAWSDINPAWWPCDQLSGGDVRTGAGCYQSLGTPAPTYLLALRSKNGNLPDPAPYVSSATSVLAPQLNILGYNGSVLQVLAGNLNNGDASASEGNTTDATFTWTFTPGGSLNGIRVTVPSSASTFSLTAAYKGGYSVTKGGTVQQVDLVPNFSLSPNPVLKNATLTLRNLMQKATAATLVTAAYSINTNPPTSNVLAPTFLVVNGTAPVTAPGTVGDYTVTVTYTYTDHNGNGQTAQTSQPFTVTDFVPQPSVMICRNNSIPCNQPAPFFGIFTLAQGTTYYLSDSETVPGDHPGVSFYKSTNNQASIGANDTLIGSSSAAGPVTFAASTACSSNCYIKASVEGFVGVTGYVVEGGGGGGCAPNCPPNPTLTLSGPSSGVTGTAVTFTAVPSDFVPTSFLWDFDDTSSAPPPPTDGCPPGAPIPGCTDFTITQAASTPGPNPNSYSYVNVGTHTVRVTASDGATTKSASKTISITGGGPLPPTAATTVTGATINPFTGNYEVDAGQTVTFTATEADANVSTTDPFAWNFGDGATAAGRTVTHAFASAGTRTVTLSVTGDGTNRVGVGTAQIHFTVAAPSFQAIMIPGAGSIESDAGTWATDLSVTNPGTRATTVTLYFAAFSDAIPSDLSTLPFDSLHSVPLDGGQSWSGVDVVRDPLGRGNAGKGILLLKFDGGNATPIVTARVYFTAQGSSFGTALPSYVVGPYGETQAQDAQTATGQILPGLRNDALYRFNVSLFNASSAGGLFHLDAFSEDGTQVASRDFAVPAFSQAGVNDTDLFTPDPSKRYVLKATGSTGSLQAFASQLDKRNNDLVQVSDDTPRVNVAPDTQINYYISGVGRIEDGNAHWRTDLRFFNPSTLQRNISLEYHYIPTGSTTEQIVPASLTVGAGQGVSLDDVVGNYLDEATAADLKTGTILGLLKVSYLAPTDIATAKLIIGGRIYADLPTGTAGMQLAVYTESQSVPPGNASLVMPGAQTNLRFRTNIGLFALGGLPTNVLISAVRKDGVVTSTYSYTLNNPGQSGAFAQIPMTALPVIDGEPMTIRVRSVSGSPVGAYIVTVDQISSDTVFIQGKPVS